MTQFLFYVACGLLGFTIYNHSLITTWEEKGEVLEVTKLDTTPKGTIVLVQPPLEFRIKTRKGVFTLSSFDVNYPPNKTPHVRDCIIVPLRQAKETIVFNTHSQATPCL